MNLTQFLSLNGIFFVVSLVSIIYISFSIIDIIRYMIIDTIIEKIKKKRKRK